jgi:hypothetical protein
MSEHARRGANLAWLVIPPLLYVAFAAGIYVVHGAEPELSIDHIAYFKLADETRAHHPDGAYWRDFDALSSYAVLLAYSYDLTASHIASLKLLLAGMTVAYLVAFERLMFFLSGSRPLSVAFSLLSAEFVSFGASYWGMTDFAASLHRSLVVPFLVVVTWLFLRFRASPWRYSAYPVLVLLTLLHLSSYYLLLVLLAYEVIDFVVLRRCQVDRRLWYFAAGVVTAVVTRQIVFSSGLGFAGYVEHSFSRAWGAKGSLDPKDAWAIELFAFPWRNMPLPLTTLANIALSYGVIFVVSVACALAVRRREGCWNALDRVMLAFTGAVLCSAYGPQTLLWVLRQFFPIFPINFEEVRAINFIMIPSLYFVSRLVLILCRETGWQPRARAAAILLAVALQPVLVLRALPVRLREALFEQMNREGILSEQDTFRTLYARQYLGLANEGPRFYYSARGALEWVTRNAEPGDRLMTDHNEFRIAGIEVVGAFQNVVTTGVSDASRREWRDEVDAVAKAMASRNIDEVRRVAKTWKATLAVVPWPEPGALYQDGSFSVIRIE